MLPILLVVSETGKVIFALSPFALENLVSRDEFASPVPRQPANLHAQAEPGAYLRDSSRVPRRRIQDSIFLFSVPVSHPFVAAVAYTGLAIGAIIFSLIAC